MCKIIGYANSYNLKNFKGKKAELNIIRYKNPIYSEKVELKIKEKK